MATLRVNPRDLDLFRALDRGPLTVRQLLKLSSTFALPFSSERYLQTRLLQLAQAGLVRRGAYATTEPSILYYYTLSPESSRLLHGQDGPAPRHAPQIGLSRQHHTRSLGDFRVHTEFAAIAAGFVFTDFYAENTLRLEAVGQSLYPDCAFTLLAPPRPPLKFFVELDTGTEPVTSARERDSWQQKLTFYEALRDTCRYRFRVLGLFTCGAVRVENVCRLAAAMAQDPRRPLFCGISLRDFLNQDEPLTRPCFHDHCSRPVALIPPYNAGNGKT